MSNICKYLDSSRKIIVCTYSPGGAGEIGAVPTNAALGMDAGPTAVRSMPQATFQGCALLDNRYSVSIRLIFKPLVALELLMGKMVYSAQGPYVE